MAILVTPLEPPVAGHDIPATGHGLVGKSFGGVISSLYGQYLNLSRAPAPWGGSMKLPRSRVCRNMHQFCRDNFCQDRYDETDRLRTFKYIEYVRGGQIISVMELNILKGD